MNIFILSWVVEQCAEWHFDKHVVKMILETAQLLSTAHHVLDPVRSEEWASSVPRKLYKKTHTNHPCAVWVRSHKNNYLWTAKLGMALCFEYTRRYSTEKLVKLHATEPVLRFLTENIPLGIPDAPEKMMNEAGVTVPVPQAMPDEYRTKEDTVKAYQNYYQGAEKRVLANWKHGNKPNWFE